MRIAKRWVLYWRLIFIVLVVLLHYPVPAVEYPMLMSAVRAVVVALLVGRFLVISVAIFAMAHDVWSSLSTCSKK